jgi:uncharacterized protein (TIGR02145 family)
MKKVCTFLILVFTLAISCSKQTSSFTDSRDGKTYKTVKIGNQIWMAENLAFKADSGYWAYNNDTSNVPKYGYLYNWETAKTVCPAGWHLPNKEEFETLLNNFGGSGETAYKDLLPGGSSGFSAQFGGCFNFESFGGIGEFTFFWSSSPDFEETAWNLLLYTTNSIAGKSFGYRTWGFSVRCLKDD